MFDKNFALTSFEPTGSDSASEPESLPPRYLVVDAYHQFLIFTFRERCWFDSEHLAVLLHQHSLDSIGQPQAVGSDTQHSYWVISVRHRDRQQRARESWQTLRVLLDQLPAAEFAVIARAQSLARWRMEHRFCGRCGRKTGSDSIDAALSCSYCRLRFYPRIAPCMIVLVTRGRELLLAHHQRAKTAVYSPLAGFIEAGETAEEAVAREVYEEVGIRIKNIRYFTSQSWPFPGQLMLAYYADYDAGTLNWRTHEIHHADWFDIDQLPTTPSDKSVAGWLIGAAVHHLNEHKGIS